MIVSCKNLKICLEEIALESMLSLDCETTGLYPYNGDRLFSIIIGTKDKQFYFNFNQYLDFDPDFILPRGIIDAIGRAVSVGHTIFMHNAKFDMGFLAQEGIFLRNNFIHDTEVVARLLRSDYESYSLDECTKRIGFEKSNAVEEYIKKHKLWEWNPLQPGKKKRTQKKFFDRVPPDVIVPYGEQDAKITFELGMHQLQQITSEKEKRLYENETLLTRTCFEMEQRGIRINIGYCEQAKAYELENCNQAAAEFKLSTGLEFCDSNKVLATAFAKLGFEPARTDKGNPSFTDKNLEKIKHPLASIIQRHRASYKKANTYYANFLGLSDSAGILHANIRQSGTFTGRFSMSEPNLQNITKQEDEDAKFKIRHAFIPREGYAFYELDYKAMEFRLMLDYAGERELCQKIKSGLDPHQATADLVKIERKKAKTLNFGLLYGMGAEKLSHALGVSLEQARTFKRQYFDALPRVNYFIKQASLVAAQRGFVHNWAGKKYYFPDQQFAYKAANAIIQGGCAEIMKFAMVEIGKYLKDRPSYMLVQVHDSILLEVDDDDIDSVPEIANIMRNAYKATHMPMDVSISKSDSTWGCVKEVS